MGVLNEKRCNINIFLSRKGAEYGPVPPPPPLIPATPSK